jgi:hypothetical protein
MENLAISIFKAKKLNSDLAPVFTVLSHMAVGNSAFWLVDVWPTGNRLELRSHFRNSLLSFHLKEGSETDR